MGLSRFWGRLALRGSVGGLAIAMVGLAVGWTPPAVAASDVAKVIADSRETLRKGDPKAALIQLKKGAKDNPQNAEIRTELGILELQTGDLLAAESDLKTARSLGGPIEKINPMLATAMLYLGKYDEVVRSILPCPQDEACKASVLSVHARAHLELKQVGLADADSKEALEAAPNDPEVKLTRGLIWTAQGDFAKAEAIVDEVLVVRPKSLIGLIAKGDLRREASDYAGAEQAFRAATEVSPRNINARTRLAIAQIGIGKVDEAQANIDKVLSQAPRSVLATYLKGLVLARANKMRQALDVVRPLEGQIATSPRGAFLLGVIHQGNGNLEEALKYAGIFHSQAPDDMVGTRLLANIEFRLGSFDRVVALLAPLRDRFSQDPAALNLLGAAYLAEGRAKEGDDVLGEAVKLRPDDVEARGQLALSKTRQSSTREEGIHELEGLVTADPKNSKMDLLLISVHMGNGDFDRAIAAATAMAARQPNNPLPLTMRGAAKLSKGDEAGAAADFAAALVKQPDFTPPALYQAEIAMRNGDYAKARAIVDKVLVKNPADIRALLARGRIEERAGAVAAAVPFYERTVAAHPDELEPRTQLLNALTEIHDDVRAAAAANDMARTLSANVSALDFAAKILVKIGRPGDAVALYKELSAQYPKAPVLHFRLGQALESAGDLAGAKAAYDRAISSGADYIPAWTARVGLEKKMNGFDAALALAQKAGKDHPNNAMLKLLAGDFLAGEGRWSEAEAFFRKQMGDNGSQVIVVREFVSINEQGDYPRARKVMDDWLSKHPEDRGARFELAQAEMRHTDYKAAAEEFALLSEKIQHDTAILNNLAWCYAQLHDPRAVAVAREAYLLAPTDGQVADTYGEVLYHGGDLKQAAILLWQAHNALPQDPSISLHLAHVLNDSKDQEGARKLLRPIVDPKVKFADQDEARKLYALLGGT